MQAPETRAKADLELLVDAAREAADLALSFFGRDPETWHKEADSSPVTEADLAVDRMLKDHLLAARPDYGWLSEETPDDARRLSNGTVFIVDPIDGTRDFIAGGKVWGHSLAVAEEGRVTAAVVLLPRRGSLYTAVRGGGAFLDGNRLTASTRTELTGATLLARRSVLDASHWPGGVPEVEVAIRNPMAYRLACLAEGRFDALFAPGGIWEWDLAAGSLLVEEAGYVITDAGGHGLSFNTPHPRAAGTLAATPILHDALLRLRGVAN